MIEVKEIKMSVPGYRPILEERETIITFDETNAPAEVFTYNPTLIRKLDKLIEERPEEVKLIRAESINGVQLREVHLPKKWVKVNPSRIVPEEERAKRAEQLRRNFNFESQELDNNRVTED